MSPVGHSLVGATIGISLWPHYHNRSARLKVLFAMVVIANIPDLPLPYWGHWDDHCYRISHSIFCGLLILIGLRTFVVRTRAGGSAVERRRLMLATSLALGSHYLLDTFYREGRGLAMFWPFSAAHIALPINLFAHISPVDVFSWHNLRVCLVEMAAFGAASLAILAIVLPIQYRWQQKKVAK